MRCNYDMGSVCWNCALDPMRRNSAMATKTAGAIYKYDVGTISKVWARSTRETVVTLAEACLSLFL